MSLQNSAQRYGTLSLSLHWLTALLILGVYTFIQLHEFYGRSPQGRAMEEWHTMTGLLVLLVTLLRLPLPALVQANPELADRIKEIHEAVGTFGYLLIAGHTAAALVHHYFLRDNTLLRMLPRRS